MSFSYILCNRVLLAEIVLMVVLKNQSAALLKLQTSSWSIKPHSARRVRRFIHFGYSLTVLPKSNSCPCRRQQLYKIWLYNVQLHALEILTWNATICLQILAQRHNFFTGIKPDAVAPESTITRANMETVVEEFYKSFSATYQELRRKSKTELRQLAKLKRPGGRGLIFNNRFF